jgi:hypothetical protein
MTTNMTLREAIRWSAARRATSGWTQTIRVDAARIVAEVDGGGPVTLDFDLLESALAWSRTLNDGARNALHNVAAHTDEVAGERVPWIVAADQTYAPAA